MAVVNPQKSAVNLILERIFQMNTKIENLSNGMNTMSDMIVQLGKADIDNKKLVDSAIERLTLKLNEKLDETQPEKRLQEHHDLIGKCRSEQQNLSNRLETFEREEKERISFLTELLYDKEDKLNKKITQSESDLKNKVKLELDAIKIEIEPLKQRLTALETASQEQSQQWKVYQKNFQNAETIVKRVEEKLKAAKDENDSRIKESLGKLNTVESNRKLMEIKVMSLETTLNSFWTHQIPPELDQFRTFVYSWKIKHIEKKMKLKKYECESEAFPLAGYHFWAKVKLNLESDKYVYMSLCFVDHNNTGQPMELKVIPQVDYILREKSPNRDKDVIASSNRFFKKSVNYGKYYFKEWIIHKSKLVNSGYIIDGSAVMDIFVEPPSIALQSFSKDGVLTWKINNYQKNKTKEKNYLVNNQASPYFYTSPEGYRVKVLMWLNGASNYRGKGLTAEVCFMTGEFDSSLPKPFDHTVTVVVFNQKYSVKNIVNCKKIAMEDYSYFIDIAPHSVLETEGFVVNDSLVYKVFIEPN